LTGRTHRREAAALSLAWPSGYRTGQDQQTHEWAPWQHRRHQRATRSCAGKSIRTNC